MEDKDRRSIRQGFRNLILSPQWQELHSPLVSHLSHNLERFMGIMVILVTCNLAQVGRI
jgi:hypothetical protein